MSGDTDRPDAAERLREVEAEWGRHPGVTLGAAAGSVGPGWRRLQLA